MRSEKEKHVLLARLQQWSGQQLKPARGCSGLQPNSVCERLLGQMKRVDLQIIQRNSELLLLRGVKCRNPTTHASIACWYFELPLVQAGRFDIGQKLKEMDSMMLYPKMVLKR